MIKIGAKMKYDTIASKSSPSAVNSKFDEVGVCFVGFISYHSVCIMFTLRKGEWLMNNWYHTENALKFDDII